MTSPIMMVPYYGDKYFEYIRGQQLFLEGKRKEWEDLIRVNEFKSMYKATWRQV